MRLNTFSIVALDPETGDLGVAVSSKFPAVGSICAWARHGVGAVATQAWTNPLLGNDILGRLAGGADAAEALQIVLSEDPGAQYRQLAVVDADGNVASHTGASTDAWTGHRIGDEFSVQGNMLTGESVLDAMCDAYTRASEKEFSERLLITLEAGQAAGGDRRGRQSASLYVPGPEDYARVDLRVDDHSDPVAELRRVYEVARIELFPVLRLMPTRAEPTRGLNELRRRLAAKNED